MDAVASHLRAELRRRWPAWLAVAVLIGVTGGLVLGSLAGARRTASAFDRMVEETDAADVQVNPDDGMWSQLSVDDVAALPGVASLGVVDGGGAVLLGVDGEIDGAAQVFTQRDPGVLVDIERPRVVEGTLFDPADPAQVMVSDDIAERHGLQVGGPVSVGTMSMEELDAWEAAGEPWPPPLTVHELTVSVVVVTTESIVDDEVFSYGEAYLTHAFAAEHETAAFYYGIAVDLEADAAGVPEFREAVQALVPQERFEFKTLAAVTETVERGARPHVIALLAFAAVVGLAGSVVCGQAVTRQLVPLVDDMAPLRAIGISGRALRAAAAVRAALITVTGAVLAVVVAVAISPLFPVGVARRAEMSPGLSVDGAVLGPGALVIATGAFGWALLGARRLRANAERRALRPGSIDRLASALRSPAAATGLRAAVASSTGRSAASPRAAMVGMGVAVAAVVAVVVFGASLVRLVGEPSAYGWPWAAVVAPPGDDDYRTDLLRRVEDNEEFTGHLVLTVDQLHIGDERVPAVGMPTSVSGPAPTIVEGRAPSAPDEMALGRRTMHALGTGIGKTVLVGRDGDRRELHVVGQAVFPGIGTYSGADRTELGKGALLDSNTLAQVGEGFDFSYIVVDAPDRTAAERGVAAVTAGYEAAVEEGEVEVILDPQRPSDIRSLERVRETPVVIAGVLAVFAAAAFAFVLLSAVRGRRRELALLKTLGFRRRDVAGTVLWQSGMTATIALAIGVPLGVVAGRAAWSALAEALGVAPEPTVPITLVAVPVAVLALAGVLAVIPGMIAARTRPALALRSE